jgi:hypothetical protein
MQELRKVSDIMLEYQANDAPPLSLKYEHYPGSQGFQVDYVYLYEREVLKNDADELERDEVTEALAEELEEMPLDDDEMPLGDEEAVRDAEAEVVGGGVNVTLALHEMQMEDQKASSDEAAKEQKASCEAAEDKQDRRVLACLTESFLLRKQL